MKEAYECNCCLAGKRPLITPEGLRVKCPYCEDTGTRYREVPDTSHKMTEWRCEILAPCGTERFYSVRNCEICDEEEWDSNSGHFLHGLRLPCKSESRKA